MTFYAGQEFTHSGVRYRVIAGNRCEGDLVIEFMVIGWHRPTIAHSFILAAFKFQVEENNYGNNGKVKRGRGGWYLLDKIKRACLHGWESEAEQIKSQRKALEIENEFVQAQLGLPI